MLTFSIKTTYTKSIKAKLFTLTKKLMILGNKDDYTGFLSYKRRNEYGDLTYSYIEESLSPETFKYVFLGMHEQDHNVTTTITKDFKQSSTFLIYPEAREFFSLLQNISEVCMSVQKFDAKKDISYQNFHKSIAKTYSKMRKFL
jgi:hypothetical protein